MTDTSRTEGRWEPWNNGSGKRIWFLSRVVDGVEEYHETPPRPPVLIRYASYETACRAAERLNSIEDAPRQAAERLKAYQAAARFKGRQIVDVDAADLNQKP